MTGFTADLVSGVEAHRADLDELIADAAENWTLDRMALIDLIVLRLGAHELVDRSDVPVGAVIDEAVELAKRFSTADSGAFVNGVLGHIATKAAERKSN